MGVNAPREASRKVLADAFLIQQQQQQTMVGTRTMPAGLQGNLQVDLLEGGKEDFNTPETVALATRDMLTELGPQSLIANLGEGLTGKEDPRLVEAFVDAVHGVSEEIIQEALDRH
jgi:uroporphyrinogen-III decarboxylase